MYNADIFLGEEALNKGLIDEIGDLDKKMKELYPDAEIVNFSKVSPFEKMMKGFSSQSSLNSFLSQVNELKAFKN